MNGWRNATKNGDKAVEKIYKKYPHLHPNFPGNDQFIYIGHDELAAIAKLVTKKINVYTELGARFTNVPWHTFGYTKSNNSKLDIKIANEHATVLVDRINPKKIV